jgi:two-component system NarL family sensor kinase
LHDSTGQNLTALAANLDEVHRSILSSNRKERKLLSESLKLAEECIREVRTVSYLLHPPMLDATGPEDAVRHYVSGFSKRTGIHVDVQFSTQFKRLMPNVELALFRVLQESFANIQRHSNSKEVEVCLERNAEKITMEIRDKGHGTSVGNLKQKGRYRFEVGVSIASMQERLKSIGGDLEIVTGSSGTTVRATLLAGVQEDAKAAHSGS